VKNNRGDKNMPNLTFEEITEELLSIAQKIVNSNTEYNLLENGREIRSLEELKDEFLNPLTRSVFIKQDGTYIGVMDYLDENPKDHYPWLGLLMIDLEVQGRGYAKQAYQHYEKEMINLGKTAVRLGVLKGNKKAKQFWESIGFVFYETKPYKEDRQVDCYEKELKK
jgi:RimJ/RimL family protein N-acetyltransferase